MKTKMQDMDENTYTLSEMKVAHLCSTLLRPHELYSPWNSPGQNSEVGSLLFLQGIFPTQGLNQSLPHCRRILYQLSHKGSSRVLEWVAYPFSRGSSRPRSWTGVSCITDSLPTELWGKPMYTLKTRIKIYITSFIMDPNWKNNMIVHQQEDGCETLWKMCTM